LKSNKARQDWRSKDCLSIEISFYGWRAQIRHSEGEMIDISKRSFVFLSSGAAAGAMLASGLNASETEAREATGPIQSSGLVTGNPKPLKYNAIPGFLSAAQIEPHFTAHYGGALKGYVDLDNRLETAAKSGPAISANAYGSMQRTRTTKGNSVLLHELYFDGMTAQSSAPGNTLRAAIEQRFGSVANWANDFAASAKAASGWALLARHPVNGALYNLVSDAHAVGLLWTAQPLIVLDVYEHAYYVDYKNQKSAYIDKFFDHIDWQIADQRFTVP
jgi:Fe-Mn family superoxide dismutase